MQDIMGHCWQSLGRVDSSCKRDYKAETSGVVLPQVATYKVATGDPEGTFTSGAAEAHPLEGAKATEEEMETGLSVKGMAV